MENKENRTHLSDEQRYKKRKAVFERFQILLFIGIIFFVGLCLLILRRSTFSETEKRELTEKPQLTAESWFSGKFASQYTKWYSDTVPMRERFVDMVSVINKYKGISAPTFYGNVQAVNSPEGPAVTTHTTTAPVTSMQATEAAETDDIPDVTDDPAAIPVEDTETAPPETETETTETEEEPLENIAEFNHNGIVVDSVKMYGDNAGIMLFGGNDYAGTRYAEVINRYADVLPSDVNIYNIVVPTSGEFYLPHKFSNFNSSQKECIDHIYSYYADTRVRPVDAYSEIAAHTDEYIYLRTDHHWSQRGAYYAYRALCKEMGKTPKDIDDPDDYEKKTKDGFVGSLYTFTNDNTLKNSPEVFTYYMPQSEFHTYYYDYSTLSLKGEGVLFHEYAEGVNMYSMFLGTDNIHVKITTSLDTGRKAIVFKESYGNAFVPYLVDLFDEIYVVDIRYFGRNAVQYIQEQGITDVIFIDNIFAANTDSLIDGIEALYGKVYGTEGGKTYTTDELKMLASGTPLPTETVTAAPETEAEPQPASNEQQADSTS